MMLIKLNKVGKDDSRKNWHIAKQRYSIVAEEKSNVLPTYSGRPNDSLSKIVQTSGLVGVRPGFRAPKESYHRSKGRGIVGG